MSTTTEVTLRNVVLIDTTDADYVILGDYDYIPVSTVEWEEIDWLMFTRSKREDRLAMARKIAAKYEEVK